MSRSRTVRQLVFPLVRLIAEPRPCSLYLLVLAVWIHVQSMAVVVGIFAVMYDNRTVFGRTELDEHRAEMQRQTARFNEKMATRNTADTAAAVPPAK